MAAVKSVFLIAANSNDRCIALSGRAMQASIVVKNSGAVRAAVIDVADPNTSPNGGTVCA